MSFKNINKNNIDLLKNPSNITGLTNIKSYSNINLNPIKKAKSLKNKFTSYNLNQKIEIIRKMLNKPSIKKPFDGFAVQANKCTIESLLQKSCEREKITIFEKNKLCKKNYPLIKFLSNRKTKNNTKNLLIEILNSEYGELTKAQENAIKYGKNKTKLKLKNININNIFLKNKKTKIDKVIEGLNGYKDYKRYNYFDILKNSEIKEKLYLTQNSRNKKTKLINTNRNFVKNLKNLKNLFIINNRPETERAYSNLGLGETVRLDNHLASKKNNNILLNRFIRKHYLSLKNDNNDYLDNDIINDITKLKFNNKIMSLNTKLLTI